MIRRNEAGGSNMARQPASTTVSRQEARATSNRSNAARGRAATAKAYGRRAKQGRRHDRPGIRVPKRCRSADVATRPEPQKKKTAASATRLPGDGAPRPPRAGWRSGLTVRLMAAPAATILNCSLLCPPWHEDRGPARS